MSKFLAVINVLERKPGYPDQGLPGIEGPVDPGYGIGIERPSHLPSFGGPVDPGYGVPLPPVVDNGLPPIHGHPDQGLPPTYPVDPGYGIPTVPGIWPKPPLPGVWPPPRPVYPSHPIYPTDTPEHPIAAPPGSVWPPLPPDIGGKILAFCWLVGIGYRWVVIDPSLKPDIGLPGEGTPSHPIAPTPGPKR
jgi:hypothetical protein